MADFRKTHDADEATHTRGLRLRLEEEERMGARIKVIGVGGGGGNAVAHMVATGIDGRSTRLREPGPGGLFANFHVVAEVAP